MTLTFNIDIESDNFAYILLSPVGTFNDGVTQYRISMIFYLQQFVCTVQLIWLHKNIGFGSNPLIEL